MSTIHITSSEKYLIDKKVQEIKNELGIEGKNDMNYLITKSTYELTNFVNTFSFFDQGNKLAIVKEVESEELIPIIENLPDNVTLIILNDLDKRKKLYKYLKKNNHVLVLNPLNKKDLSNWIVDTAKDFGCEISLKNAQHIIELTGETDMYNILHQVEKISFMKEKVTANLIDKIVDKSLLVNSFELTNAILYKDLTNALSTLDKLIKNNTEMIPLLSLINKNFCIIKSLTEVSESDLKEIGINPYVIKNLRPFVNSFSIESLNEYIELCQSLDFDLKNGYEPKMVMERLILNIN